MEEVLAREMGYVGRFQIRVFCVLFFNAILCAFSANEYIFTAGRIDTRCFVSECEIAPHQSDFTPSWIDNAIPRERDGAGFESCLRFGNTTFTEQIDETCPAELFDRSTTIDCENYVYQNTNTAVYDLGLGCDEWRRSILGSARTFGTLLSLPLTGFVSDRWGRRTALVLTALNTAWIGLSRYFVSTYHWFVTSVFFEAVLGAGGMLSTGYILTMELAPTKHRVTVGTISNSFFAIGQVILGLLAWALPYWRHLTLTLYAPHFLCIAYIWLLTESVRWYLSKERYEDAESVLKQIAKTNGKEFAEKSAVELKKALESRKNTESAELITREQEPWLIVLVFKHKPILLRCIVGPIWWITMTLIYYGLSINAVNISGNPYLNYVVVAAIEIPGFWFAKLLVQRIGRKPVLLAAYWICAAGQVAFIFIPNGYYVASLTVYLISKCAIASVVMTLYLYTMEIFPTPYRQTLFAFSSMVGRLGSVVAPLTPALGELVWVQLPFAIFAGMSFLSGLLVILTPETNGCPLPNTMQEAVDIGKKKHENSRL